MRTKTVFPTDELTHIWAKQSQSEGRNAARNVYFIGPKIYSYGSHFCMGNIIKPGIVLINANSYSNTTAKHMSAVRYAVNHMQRIEVDKPDGSLADNLKGFIYDIKNQLDIIAHPRKRPATKEQAKGELSAIVERVNVYLTATGQTVSKKLPYESEEKTRKEFLLYLDAAKSEQAAKALQTKLERKAKAEAKIKAAKEAEAKAEAMKELLKWRAGRSNKHQGYYDLPVMLRVIPEKYQRRDGKEIETSKGARVSYDAGKLLYKAIQAGRDIKGYDIEGYTVISVNGSLKIGCHEIDMKEIQRFAKKEGW